jgi:hypothetical protein
VFVLEAAPLAQRNLKPLTRLSTRANDLRHARLLDLLRDAPSRAPRLRSGYRAAARIFRSRAISSKDAFGRTLQPTLSKTSTRARCSCRPADEREARVERRTLCFNGIKVRFGRLVLPRRANVLGSLTRAFRADL